MPGRNRDSKDEGYVSISQVGRDFRLFVQDAQPDSSEVAEGYLWSDTSAPNRLMRATDSSTFVGVGADALHAAAHADGGADELAVQDLATDAATVDQIFKADGSGGGAFADDFVYINFIIDGGGSAITTGIKGGVEVPAGTIVEMRLLADQSGSIVVDIWKDTYANYPPTDADSITASAVPTISTDTKATDATLTGWTTALTAEDILYYNVDSVTTIERVTVVLKVRKS